MIKTNPHYLGFSITYYIIKIQWWLFKIYVLYAGFTMVYNNSN